MASRASLAALLWLCAALAVPWPPGLSAAGGLPAPRPTSEDCPRTCGGVEIPFPFGTGPNHCMLPGFQIQCSDIGNGTRKPFLRPNVELLGISLLRGDARILNYISSYCYDAASRMKHQEWRWKLTGSPFTFSDTANKFRVLGCRTQAYIGDSRGDAATYTTGCVAMCDAQRALVNGSCSGMGCCETAIPSGLQYYQVWFDRRFNTSKIKGASPCSFAVLMETSNFNFSTSYVTSLEFNNSRSGSAPVVLDWGIGKDDCGVAPTKPGYACVSSNSECLNAAGGRGYICKCKQGFEGNPYLNDGVDGCKDINECGNHKMYPCFGHCINTNGTFTCSCPAGTKGNASIQECQRDPFPMGAQLGVGFVAAVLLILIVSLATQVFFHKRSSKRQGYFEQHGGQVLSGILKSEGNLPFTFTLYDRGDIEKATRKFHKTSKIGEGAHGTVYKAILSGGDDNTMATVAVKRCKQIDRTRKEEFIRELVVLCRVNHPNIVRLLGCCLHFEAPMLVYEFVQNGNLKDLLYGRPRSRVMLATRLRMAAETAEALAHLHSLPHTILHGDVKPDNILLGDGWIAKVSDFGCSTIDDNIQVVPKGTLAYLDPEFLQDFQLTDKTDVYSFGVVLMELLTRKKPRAKDQKNLLIMFQECMGNNGTLVDLLDTDIVKEASASTMGVIHEAAELASRCTAIPGYKRPAMGEVAEKLLRLSVLMPEDTEALQALEGHGYSHTASETETTGFYGIGNKASLSTELAR